MVANSEDFVSAMAKTNPRKGKGGKSGKEVVLGPRRVEDAQGGSGEEVVKEVEKLEVVPMVDLLLFKELSGEQRAVDKAVEVQAVRDEMAQGGQGQRWQRRAGTASRRRSSGRGGATRRGF